MQKTDIAASDLLVPEATVLPVADAPAELPHADSPAGAEVSLGVRVANLTAVVLPMAAVVLGMVSLWGRGFTWVDFALLSSMYALTVLGITVGYHRFFTHRSFETHGAVALVLAVLGSMAVQGRLFNWVALHRRHHQHSDAPGDPHSPHLAGSSFWGVLRGMWHAHLGWLFKPHLPDLPRYVKDLQQSAALRIVDKTFFLWVALGLVIPAIVGGLITGTYSGAFWGFMWGGLVRVLLVHHVTWSVNSVCHLWGRRPFQSSDESRNNFLFGVLAFGEGWHNTHHAFPTSARHGLRWWQIDVSYWVILALSWLRLAWNLKMPSRQLLRAKSNHW